MIDFKFNVIIVKKLSLDIWINVEALPIHYGKET